MTAENAAARVDGRADAARGDTRTARRADGRDPAVDRAGDARRRATSSGTGRALWLDCDALQADGGTRAPAAITGAYVAAHRALDRLGLTKALRGSVAAVSVGIVDGEPLLDLDYSEDSRAETDMNVVMTADGLARRGSGRGGAGAVPRELLDRMLDLAARGITELGAAQRAAAEAPSL